MYTIYCLIFALFLVILILIAILIVKFKTKNHSVILHNDKVNSNTSLKDDSFSKVRCSIENDKDFEDENKFETHNLNNNLPENSLTLNEIIRTKHIQLRLA